MNKATAMMIAHTLKGPGLSCLFIMLALPQHTGPKTLAKQTGYNRRQITKGLEVLAELGLAIKTSRFDGWQLTTEGYQLNLFNPENSDLPLEGEIFPLPSLEGEILPLVSSSSSLTTTKSSSLKKELLQTTNEGEKLPLVKMLTKKSCNPKLANEAIDTALSRGDSPQTIQHNITAWLKYCNSEQGKSIKTPGVVIARRIRDDIEPPEIKDKEEDGEEWYTAEERKLYVVH